MKKFIRYTYVKNDIGQKILGVITGDSRFPDNHRLLTSIIVDEFEKDKRSYAKTESGSIYELGDFMEPRDFFEREKDVDYNGIGVYLMKEILGIKDSFKE